MANGCAGLPEVVPGQLSTGWVQPPDWVIRRPAQFHVWVAASKRNNTQGEGRKRARDNRKIKSQAQPPKPKPHRPQKKQWSQERTRGAAELPKNHAKLQKGDIYASEANESTTRQSGRTQSKKAKTKRTIGRKRESVRVLVYLLPVFVLLGKGERDGGRQSEKARMTNTIYSSEGLTPKRTSNKPQRQNIISTQDLED